MPALRPAALVAGAVALSMSLTACGSEEGAGDRATTARPGADSRVDRAETGPAPDAERFGRQAGDARPGDVAWPTDALAGGTAPVTPSLLAAVRAASHAGYDRVVLDFAGPVPAYRVGYVAQATEEPSGRPLALRGDAVLRLVLQGATTDTTLHVEPGGEPRRYQGPRRLRPGLPVVREVAEAGDLEGVLTVAVGVAAPAGFRVSELSGPSRLVLDVQR